MERVLFRTSGASVPWLVDLDTGAERQLTNFSRDAVITDFDVSSDGREIVFDRVQENSDIVLIERPRR